MLETLMMIALLAVMVTITYFIARKVIFEIKSAKDEKSLLIDGILTRSDINSVITSYITRIAKGTTFSLIYIDLDKFGDLSEAFGEKESKNILENIAKRIKKLLPTSAKIARYTGDEFLIFLNNQYSQKQVTEYGYKILYELRNKTKVAGGTEIDLTASVAVCYYPMHGNSLKNLMDSLKIAIYQAKKNGGNSLKIYSEELKDQEESIEYYYQIKHAIERHEFQLYYQPMIDYTNKKIYGYEALLRWNHPTLGVLGPDKFINIMEQTGDIHWVGRWGIESIIKTSYELRGIHSMYDDVKISINLSPKQLLSETIASDFAKAVKKLKGNPKNIILEVGEFALFEKQEQIFENLVKLSEVGFSIAVDGFSIDLATINRLSRINMDMIKMRQKTITENETNGKYLELLLNYVKTNGKLVVAEGVEALDEVKKIAKLGVELFQGYYFGTPMPFIELQDYTDKFMEKFGNLN
ncbi:bifunctional diguanylate cyclase/phosphodiesterase [Acholeplasma hippikon]|uniref:Cyclic di-GMP phosphodiesterase Gmr n=1 Tax=Acholeplasma hippikon TaxID=264636 RepID=A0A449BLM4_9MOLU|nr:bifunctional diguanylate cyclase/phosphodiesterase [Acholeplasma hippikon]VEU83323.1 Cyclic di-GMP phosphodiesterase Gmr [Acholeplasma hippikon]